MAFMNVWLFAVAGLVPPLLTALVLALQGASGQRLVAVQFATTLTVLMLVLLSMAVDQPSFLDLPLTLVLVSYPGTMLYTHFLERWL